MSTSGILTDAAMVPQPGSSVSLDAVFNILSNLKLVTYFHVIAISVFLYDYFLTLGREASYIWPARWNLMKSLFLVQRYLPFVDTVFVILHRDFGANLNAGYCRGIFTISAVLYMIGILFCEAILSLRVWAVWGRNRAVGFGMIAMLFVAFALALYSQYAVVRTIKFGQPPIPLPGIFACFITEAGGPQFLGWIVVLVYQGGEPLLFELLAVINMWCAVIVLLLLMIIAAFRASRRGSPSSLTALVYRDGCLYYMYLFVLSIANIIVARALAKSFMELLWSLERVIYSCLTSRVVLHIREHEGLTENLASHPQSRRHDEVYEMNSMATSSVALRGRIQGPFESSHSGMQRDIVLPGFDHGRYTDAL